MKVKGKQIKDIVFGIECHHFDLTSSILSHTMKKKSIFAKKVSVVKFNSNFYQSWESTLQGYMN